MPSKAHPKPCSSKTVRALPPINVSPRNDTRVVESVEVGARETRSVIAEDRVGEIWGALHQDGSVHLELRLECVLTLSRQAEHLAHLDQKRIDLGARVPLRGCGELAVYEGVRQLVQIIDRRRISGC